MRIPLKDVAEKCNVSITLVSAVLNNRHGRVRYNHETRAKILDAASDLGYQTNIYPFLQEADLFLLPSRFEGMPMTIIEAMGTGLPVVATAGTEQVLNGITDNPYPIDIYVKTLWS